MNLQIDFLLLCGWGPDCERPWPCRSSDEPKSGWQKDTWYLSKYAWLKWNVRGVASASWIEWNVSTAMHVQA